MKNPLTHGVRGALLTVFVLAAITCGPLHVSIASSAPYTPGLGRLGRDLLRRAGSESGGAVSVIC